LPALGYKSISSFVSFVTVFAFAVMIFKLVLRHIQDDFTGGVGESIDKMLSQTSGRSRPGRSITAQHMAREGADVHHKLRMLERDMFSACVAALVVYSVLLLALVTISWFFLGWLAWFAACFLFSLFVVLSVANDASIVSRIKSNVTHKIASATVDQSALIVDGLIDSVMATEKFREHAGFFGRMESNSEGEEIFEPFQWVMVLIRGSLLAMSVKDQRAAQFGRFVEFAEKFSGKFGGLVSKTFRASGWGVGHKRAALFKRFTRPWMCDPPNIEVEMQPIPGQATQSEGGEAQPNPVVEEIQPEEGEAPRPKRPEGWYIKKAKEYFVVPDGAPSWVRLSKDFVFDNPAGTSATTALMALMAYGGYQYYTGDGFKRPGEKKFSSERRQKDREPMEAQSGNEEAAHEELFHGIEEGAVWDAIQKFLVGSKASCNGFSPEMVTAHADANARVLRWKKAVKADPTNHSLRSRLINAQTAYDKLWADCMRSAPDTASFIPGALPASPAYFGMKKSAGPPEAKGKSKPYKTLKKSGKTSDGNRYWAYDDENGKTMWFYELGEDAVFEGNEYEMLAYMNRRGDYYDDEELDDVLYSRDFEDRRGSHWLDEHKGDLEQSTSSEPKPAKKDKKVRMESSLSKSGVKLADVRMLLLRNKADNTLYQNAPIVDAKVLVYKHTFGKGENSVRDNREKFELWDPVKQVAFPLTERFVTLQSNKELVCFPVPDGYKSNSFQRGEFEGTHEDGVVVGYGSHDCTHFSVASGEIRKKGSRHTCATSPGWCGSLVFSSKGNAPRLCGLHIYGDDGSDSNGFFAFTKELNDELRQVKWPKN